LLNNLYRPSSAATTTFFRVIRSRILDLFHCGVLLSNRVYDKVPKLYVLFVDLDGLHLKRTF